MTVVHHLVWSLALSSDLAFCLGRRILYVCVRGTRSIIVEEVKVFKFFFSGRAYIIKARQGGKL
jgi:hypothetical protein